MSNENQTQNQNQNINLKNLCELLKTDVLYGEIITDGNCFFHALEYALGNCDLEANNKRLYKKTRIEVATYAIEYLKQDFPRLMKEYKEQPRSRRDIERYKEWTKKKLRFLERFKTNNEYSNEDIIYHAAMMKQKILCIVEEEEPNKMSIVCPNIPFTRDNIVMLVHSGGNHYNTFEYPIHLPKDFIYALKNYKMGPFDSLMEEHGITVKDITLGRLLDFIVESRLRHRRTKNKRTNPMTFKNRKNASRTTRL